VAEQMRRHGWKTQTQAAKAAGLNRSLFSRWLDPNHPQPSVRNCRVAARAFGVPLLNVLVVAGHITAEEAGITPEPMSGRLIEDMSALELAVELQRKIAEEALDAAGPEHAQGNGDGGGDDDDDDDDDVMLYRAEWPPPNSVPPSDPEDPRRASGGD
jgi:hypothetical protein